MNCFKKVSNCMSLKENLTFSSNTHVLKGSETYGERLQFAPQPTTLQKLTKLP